jgi:PleD family two-component response regulator
MKRRVVHVDVVEVNLRILESLVRNLTDVEMFAFTSSAEALAAAPGIAPDLFVVNSRMPTPDGLEMLAEIRTCVALRDVPVVILIGENERTVCYDALDNGANDFLVRPIGPREFTQRVGNLLALHDAQKRVASLLENETRLAELQAHRLAARFPSAASGRHGAPVGTMR